VLPDVVIISLLERKKPSTALFDPAPADGDRIRARRKFSSVSEVLGVNK